MQEIIYTSYFLVAQQISSPIEKAFASTTVDLFLQVNDLKLIRGESLLVRAAQIEPRKTSVPSYVEQYGNGYF